MIASCLDGPAEIACEATSILGGSRERLIAEVGRVPLMGCAAVAKSAFEVSGAVSRFGRFEDGISEMCRRFLAAGVTSDVRWPGGSPETLSILDSPKSFSIS